MSYYKGQARTWDRLTPSVLSVFGGKAERERNLRYKEADETCLPLLKIWWGSHPDEANYMVSEHHRYVQTLHNSQISEWSLDRVEGIRRDNVNFLFFASRLGDEYWRYATPQLAQPDNSLVCRHLYNQCLKPYDTKIRELVYGSES